MTHKRLSLLLCLLVGTAVQAQSAAAPITIEADRLEMSQEEGRSHYHGRVQLRQGELLLRADTLELRQQQRQLQQAIADGAPVYLEMRDQHSGQAIRAEATHMDYRLDSARIEMRGQAVLWRGQDEFRGEHLIYHIEERRVQAFGKPDDTDGDGRVRIILQPEPTR